MLGTLSHNMETDSRAIEKDKLLKQKAEDIIILCFTGQNFVKGWDNGKNKLIYLFIHIILFLESHPPLII